MSHTHQSPDQSGSDNGPLPSTSYDEPALSVWTVQPGSHTFTSDKIKSLVERHLTGSVPNLCAGPTRLDHDGAVLRNDIDNSLETDFSVDAQLISSCLPPNSVDTVVLDPPFSERQAREAYSESELLGPSERREILGKFDADTVWPRDVNQIRCRPVLRRRHSDKLPESLRAALRSRPRLRVCVAV